MITRRNFLHTTTATMATIAAAGLTSFGVFDTANAASKGVSYGPNSLDIYPAKGTARARENGVPIVIFVHGGAWRAGNKSRVGSKAKYFTKRGYMFVSVGYTLYPRANASRQAKQVGKAVSWIRANAARYGGDPERIALMGHSAGSHLVALATFTGAASGVKALICNDTRAYDLPFLAKRNGGRIPALYSALSNKKFRSSWSPISYVGLKRQPPTLVAWSGGSGRDVISLNFVRALAREGNSVVRYDGSSRYNHLSINSKMGAESGGVTAAVSKFIEGRIG